MGVKSIDNEISSQGADLAVVILSGLANRPCGPERSKACGARRLEIQHGIRQVQHILDETDKAALDAAEARGVDDDQRELCVGRLKWAAQTTAGLQQATLALKLLEQADATCDSVVESAPLAMTYGPRRGPLRCSVPTAMYRDLPAARVAEYQGLLAQLDDCKQRIADLTAAFGSADALPEDWPVAQRGPPPPARASSDFWAGLWSLVAMNTADMGRALYPAVGLSELLRSLFSLLLESQGALDAVAKRSLTQGPPRPRVPFP
mmetsp:Transcript_79064/g.245246  ORF Transcript_79064/g.245246 Transcript_79064/m.245246 type:complete len:263 (+) Transcript_79064:66-854(+)